MNGVAIITGASSGLGAATGEVFADAGWNVVLAARRRARLEEVAGRLDGAPRSSLVVPTDVSDPHAVDALIDATLDRFGHVDVLINSAAIDHPGPITDVTVQQWREIIDVNLNGVFYIQDEAARFQGGSDTSPVVHEPVPEMGKHRSLALGEDLTADELEEMRRAAQAYLDGWIEQRHRGERS